MAIIQTMQEAISNVKDGMKIFTAGFLAIGAPVGLIDALADTNVKDLTVIQCVSAHSGGTWDIGKLVKISK